jgi:hypothetical protein
MLVDEQAPELGKVYEALTGCAMVGPVHAPHVSHDVDHFFGALERRPPHLLESGHESGSVLFAARPFELPAVGSKGFGGVATNGGRVAPPALGEVARRIPRETTIEHHR